MPKKRAARKLAKKAAALFREGKQAVRNIKSSAKAAKKAIKSVAKAVSKPKKKPAKKTPTKSKTPRTSSNVYELRDAPFLRGNTVVSRLASLDRNAPKYDKMLAPGEKYLVKLFGHETYRTFGSATQINNYLNSRYPVFDEMGRQVEDPHNDLSLMNNVQILKTGEGAKEHNIRRRSEKEERRVENKSNFSKLAKQYGSRDEKGKLRSGLDYAMMMKRENDELKEKQRQLDERLAALEKSSKRGAFARVKKAAKKATKAVLTPQQKAAITRKANREAAAAEAARKAAIRSEAAKRAAQTRAKNKAAAAKAAAKRSKAAKKAARTRKANQKGKKR